MSPKQLPTEDPDRAARGFGVSMDHEILGLGRMLKASAGDVHAWASESWFDCSGVRIIDRRDVLLRNIRREQTRLKPFFERHSLCSSAPAPRRGCSDGSDDAESHGQRFYPQLHCTLRTASIAVRSNGPSAQDAPDARPIADSHRRPYTLCRSDRLWIGCN